MKLIVGLGNPGKKYVNDRHNLGFMVIDSLSEYYDIELSHKKFKAQYGRGSIRDESVFLVRPLTYMNLSGDAVQSLAGFFKIDSSDIIVVADDLNLDFGRIRIRKKGSSGGHNGLKSITNRLGTDLFIRVRVGVGLPNTSTPISDYVLSQFRAGEKNELDCIIDKAKDAVSIIISQSVEKAMNQFNT